MKNTNLRSLRPQGGFVLVLALVILTLLFAAASGLYLNRQMWAFASTKQMDQTVMDVSTRTDAQNWVLQFRNAWQASADGLINLSNSPVPLSGGSLSSISGGGNFQAVSPYPKYPTSLGSLTIPNFFPTNGLSTPAPYVAGEPFWGTRSVIGALGVTFRREMGGGSYTERDERFIVPNLTNNTGSHLRAWFSMDGALPLNMVFRVLPVTSFTLFVAGGQFNPPRVELGAWMNSLATSYTLGPYSVSQIGQGRIYVENSVEASANVSSGFPIVATGGFLPSGFNFNLYFPTLLGGGTQAATWPNGDDAQFRAARYSTFRGFLVTSSDAPARLLRRGVVFNDNRWGAAQVQALATNMVASTSIQITANVDAQTIGISSDLTQFPISQHAAFTNPLYWLWDVPNQELRFAPPAGFLAGFGTPPKSLAITLTGASAPNYSVRVRMANAGVPFTIVVPGNPLVLENGFNQDGTVPAMLVAPRIQFSAVASGPYRIRAAVVTEARVPRYPIVFKGASGNPIPNVELQGPLIIWRQISGIVPGTPVGLTLTPVLNYLDGTWVPPLTPAVVDVRASTEGFKIYELGAVEP
jgi:hypothetical protein